MKTIAKIAAWILIFFGVLFIWGAFSPQGQTGWIAIGLVSVGLGFGLIWYAGNKLGEPGGALSDKNVAMVGGALTVTCPYCGAVYQLEEKPKW
jgi:hypothetical protein